MINFSHYLWYHLFSSLPLYMYTYTGQEKIQEPRNISKIVSF